MYCTYCGKEVQEGAVACPGCGRPLRSAPAPASKGGQYGIPALVLGVVCLPLFFTSTVFTFVGLVFAVLALVFGISGLVRGERGMAIAGTVLGGLCALALPLLWGIRQLLLRL
jgi:hypothetical protein